MPNEQLTEDEKVFSRIFAVQRTPREHLIAVIVIALVATVFGCGFLAMQTVLRGGMSVGAAIGVRFALGTLAITALMRWQRVRFDRKSARDGAVLGLLLVAIFWLQTDGLQFTTTAKSGLITSLYVPFTPMLAFVIRDRVRTAHWMAALIATAGMYLLVHVPGTLWGGWNRGDVETLFCAILSTMHVTYTARASRRSNAWVLAWMQIAITGGVSLAIAGTLPGSNGLQNVFVALQRTNVQVALTFMVCFNTVFAFWGLSKMQGYLSATEAAIIFSLEPMVAWAIGVFWIGETFSSSQTMGAGLILLGMLTAELLPRVAARMWPRDSEA